MLRSRTSRVHNTSNNSAQSTQNQFKGYTSESKKTLIFIFKFFPLSVRVKFNVTQKPLKVQGTIMTRVSVYFDSKYGNTKLVAEKIAEGLQSQGLTVTLSHVREVRLEDAVCSDAFVLGAPNHMAQPSRAMKRFIEYLTTADLKATKVAVFGTYSGRVRIVDRAVKKMEGIVQAKLPNLKLVLSGLSVRVNGVRGPVVAEELPKCTEFGAAIAAQLKA